MVNITGEEDRIYLTGESVIFLSYASESTVSCFLALVEYNFVCYFCYVLLKAQVMMHNRIRVSCLCGL